MKLSLLIEKLTGRYTPDEDMMVFVCGESFVWTAEQWEVDFLEETKRVIESRLRFLRENKLNKQERLPFQYKVKKS